MNVLIACEESQTVCKAYRQLGLMPTVATSLNVLESIQSGISKVTYSM